MPKLVCAPVKGSDKSTTETKDPKYTLVGDTNEVDILLGNRPARALLDTGSCVSIVAESFYQEHLSHREIRPVDEILNIECADGQSLPYKGYIETEIRVQRGLPMIEPLPCLLLVTPNTQYSSATPVILGTNVLKHLMDDCKQKVGVQFLQTAELHTPWYLSFRAISVRERELIRNKDRVAVVKCASQQKITINPNQSVEIEGYTDKELNYPGTTAILQESELSQIPSSLDVTPTVIIYSDIKNATVKVTLSNLSTQPVTIQPKSILCEVQPVTVAEDVFDKIEEIDKHEEVLQGLNIDESNILEPEQKEQLMGLLRKHRDIFSTSDTDIGICNRIKHRIDLKTNIPFKQRHRRIPPSMIEEVRNHIEQLLASGVIRPSKSPYTSNVVLVRKKNGKLRLCVDYRQLNEITVKDSFALPRMEEIFDCLHGASYFSTMDMKSGYHQIEVEETHKERTAFTVGSIGFYEYNKLPFGLTNAPATYQRIMQEILGDYNNKICLIYLDDLIIFSKTFDEHLHNLDLILTRLHEACLKLAPEKCFFFRPRVNFLGHVVTADGIETDPEKIEKVKTWPKPENPAELRSFLAFAGYYRKFIKNFSQIARPLSEMLPPTSPKNQKRQEKMWKWTEVEQKVFDQLKELLSSPPVLAYPDFTLPFELHTDASTKALGAVLYQTQNGQKRVIAYASRALSRAEQNYSAFKLEYLALKWAITEKFSDYLVADRFTVLTDNNPLTHILTSAKLDATGQRWASALGQYCFDIHYRAGLRNADADALSRYPYHRLHDEDQIERIAIDDETVKAICSVMIPAYIDILPMASMNIAEVLEDPSQSLAQKDLREIRRAQRSDNIIDRWRIAVIDKKMPKRVLVREDLSMKKQFKNLTVKRGVLYRNHNDPVSGVTITQLVIPKCYRNEIMTSLHNQVGHPGQDRTNKLIRERFYWPGMGTDIIQWVSSCDRCIRRKSTIDRAPLVNVDTTYPLELVCMDFLSLEPAKGNIGNVLVITDHYTKFAKAIPTKNQTARTTAEALFNEFIMHYGVPTRLHSDQGANFESEIIRELCNLTGMKKSHTTPYHPQGNAGPERFNRTLLNMLGTLENDQKKDWKRYVNSLVYYYNCTPHETTKFSPYELLFGRKPKLPIDVMFQSVATKDISKSTEEYLEDLQERMEQAHQIVQKHTEKAKARQKQYYDKKTKPVKITVGDEVLVKRLAFDGKHKLQDKFEEEVYLVEEQPREDLPVFRVKSPSGRERTLHRNKLYLVKVCDIKDEDVEVIDHPEETSKADASEEATEKGIDVNDDEDSDGEEDENARSAFWYGDAHSSETVLNGGESYVADDADDDDIDETTTTSGEDIEESEPPSDPETETTDARDRVSTQNTEPEVGIHNEVVDVDTGIAEQETDVDETVEQVSSIVPETQDEVGIEEQQRGDPPARDDEQSDVEELDTRSVTSQQDEEGSHRSTGEEEEEAAENTDEESNQHTTEEADDERANEEQDVPVRETRDTTEVQNREPIRPTPPPRRSVRERKQPVKYEDYQLFQMVNRPVDSRLQNLDRLMSSGLLGEVDSETAHRMIYAIMDG